MYIIIAFSICVVLIGLSVVRLFSILRDTEYQSRKPEMILPMFFLITGVSASVYLTAISGYAPQVEIHDSIKDNILSLSVIKEDLVDKENTLNEELENIKEQLDENVLKFKQLQDKYKLKEYGEAILHGEVINALKLIREQRNNISRLSKIQNALNKKKGEIDLLTIKAKNELLEWESRGGKEGDIESFIIEQKTGDIISQSSRKLNMIDKDDVVNVPLSKIWEEYTEI